MNVLLDSAAILAGIAAAARKKSSAMRGELRPEMSLVEDLQLDSIRLLSLAMAVEDHFRIALDAEDEGGINRVADLVALVRAKLAAPECRLPDAAGLHDRSATTAGDTAGAARRPVRRRHPLPRPPRKVGLRLLGRDRGVGGRGGRRAARARRRPGRPGGAALSHRPRASSTRFFGILRPAPCRCRSTRRCASAGSSEYHRRTAAMLAAAGARLALADARLRRCSGRRSKLARAALPAFSSSAASRSPSCRPARRPARRRPRCPTTWRWCSSPRAPPSIPSRWRCRTARSSPRSTASTAPGPRSRRSSERRRPTGVSWLPLYHDMGLIGCIFAGACRCLPSSPSSAPELFIARPALWLRAMSRTRAAISVAPNFAYGLCLEKIRDEELEGVDLSAWKVALVRRRAGVAGGAARVRRTVRQMGLPGQRR